MRVEYSKIVAGAGEHITNLGMVQAFRTMLSQGVGLIHEYRDKYMRYARESYKGHASGWREV